MTKQNSEIKVPESISKIFLVYKKLFYCEVDIFIVNISEDFKKQDNKYVNF